MVTMITQFKDPKFPRDKTMPEKTLLRDGKSVSGLKEIPFAKFQGIQAIQVSPDTFSNTHHNFCIILSFRETRKMFKYKVQGRRLKCTGDMLLMS